MSIQSSVLRLSSIFFVGCSAPSVDNVSEHPAKMNPLASDGLVGTTGAGPMHGMDGLLGDVPVQDSEGFVTSSLSVDGGPNGNVIPFVGQFHPCTPYRTTTGWSTDPSNASRLPHHGVPKAYEGDPQSPRTPRSDDCDLSPRSQATDEEF